MTNEHSPKILHTQSGETLVMVLIALGLASVVTLIFASIFTDVVKSQNTIKVKNEIEQFHQEMIAHLGQKQACYNTFRPLGPYPNVGKTGTGVQIMDAETAPTAPTIKFTPGGTYGGGSFRITDIRYVYRDVPPLAGSAGEIEVSVTYETLVQVIGPSRLKPRVILLSTNKNVGTQSLIECASKSSLSDELWKISPVDSRNIYYNAGNVGVGVEAPRTVFHVVDFSAGNPRGIVSAQYSPDGNGAQVNMMKARGGTLAPAPVLQGDNLGGLHFMAYNGNGFAASAIVQAVAEQTISPSSMGTGLRFMTTPNNSSVPIPALTIAGAGNTQISSINGADISTLTLANTVGNTSLSFLKPGRRWNIGIDSGDGDKLKFSTTQAIPNFLTDAKLTIGTEGYVGIGTSTVSNNPLSILNPTGNAAIKITSLTYNSQIRMDSAATGVTSFLGNGAFGGGGSLGIGTLTGHPLEFFAGGFKAGLFPYGGSYTFQVNGPIYTTYLYQGSDARLKKHVRPLTDDLEKLSALRGVRYVWRTDRDESKPQIGLIAQNVESVYPEVVAHGEDGMKSLDYSRLVAPIINAIKTLAARLTSLEKHQDERYEELKRENARLREMIEALQDKSNQRSG